MRLTRLRLYERSNIVAILCTLGAWRLGYAQTRLAHFAKLPSAPKTTSLLDRNGFYVGKLLLSMVYLANTEKAKL